jgi:glycosyltransferase involved in cell wall biosynthesis
MKNPPATKLSIILPVYKVEPYLERCLRSLLEQDIPKDDYEIIVVNDGSPDNSRYIVLKLLQESNNILLIEQENRGVSVARNVGLKAALGEFVLFIDPDDAVVGNSLKKFYVKAKSEQLEVLYMGFEEWSLSGNYNGNNDYSQLEGSIYSGVQAYKLTRDQNFKIPDRSVGILFNRSFLINNNLSYTADIPYLQDGHFDGKVLCLAKRCGFLNRAFYIHFKRPGSTTTSNVGIQKKGINGFLIAAINLREFKTLHSLNAEQIELIHHLIAKYVLAYIMHSVSSRSIEIVKKSKKELINNDLTKLDLRGIMGIKQYALLYNLSFWYFVIYFIVDTRWKKLKNWLHKGF